MGAPVFNKNDLHFFAKNNFSGNLLNWTYFPDSISTEKINSFVKICLILIKFQKRN